MFVVAAVGGAGGGVAGLSDLFGVEAAGSDCGGDEGPDDALEVHGGRLVVEGAFEGLGHALDGDRVLGADGFVFGDDEAEGLGDVFRDALVGAELDGGLEGDGGAGFALGGGLGAVRGHCRRSFSSCAVGRWPIASSCPSVRLKEARPGRPAPGAKRRAEASAEDGVGRRFCFARNSAPLS